MVASISMVLIANQVISLKNFDNFHHLDDPKQLYYINHIIFLAMAIPS